MPTPRDSTTQLQLAIDPHLERPSHTTCPTELERPGGWGADGEARPDSDNVIGGDVMRHEATPPLEIDDHSPVGLVNQDNPPRTKTMTMDQDNTEAEGSSPMSITTEPKDTDSSLPSTAMSSAVGSYSSVNYGIPNVRMTPNHTSSFLRAGSKFKGTQQSDRQNYNVEVDIKHVDMAESELCGYLRIEGLTPDHPTLTTYFEGEIIGPKYTFQTRHPSWGATDKTDMQHWARFPAWRPLAKQAKKPDFHYKNSAQRENIFMRWKESFLVPDHRVREILGASFEGFYYICFNQVTGNVSGIYFHARSEKYQQLELKHIDDKGCYGAMEFR